MTGPSLQRTATLSLLIHVTFLVILVVLTRKSSDFVMPSPYVVRLVAPEAAPRAKQAAPKAEPLREKAPEPAPPPAEKKAPPPRVEEKGVRVEPPRPAARAEKKAPEKPAPPEESADYKRERLRALREKRETERYISDRLSALEAKKKLREVAALSKAVSVEVKTPAPSGAGTGEPGAGDVIVSEYAARVHDEIWQNWVFPDAGVGDIEAVVGITIMKDGKVKVNGFEKTSGNALFDRSAVKAIEKASPLSRPPYRMEMGVRFRPYAR